MTDIDALAAALLQKCSDLGHRNIPPDTKAAFAKVIRRHLEGSGDGAILDRLVDSLRREGCSQRLYDSVPADLFRKAMRRFR